MTSTTTAIILTIGTEITRGELVDLNSAWLANEMTSRGYDVVEIITVADNDSEILAAFKRAAHKANVVLTTGGLGPTSDDRTTQIAAQLLQENLVLDQKSAQHIQALIEARGRVMTDSNRKQAYFPNSATVLSNTRGTAPGFFIDYNPDDREACRLFFMPGVPSEMKGIFLGSLLPYLRESSTWTAVRRLQSCGISESDIGDRLKPLEEKYAATIGYRASAGRIEVKIMKSGLRNEKSELESICHAAFQEIEADLGKSVMGIGRKGLGEILMNELKDRGLSLATAESCTGGMAAEKITSIAGASSVFKGGVVCYENEMKSRLLHVDPKIFELYGAVSSECAQAMSQGAREALGVDCAISWTGIAGPDGGSSTKPVGLVHFSISTAQQTLNFQRQFLGGRKLVQEYAVNAGFFRLIEILRDQKVNGALQINSD